MKRLLQCLTLALLTAGLTSQKQDEIDPCLEKEHKTLKNPYRSTGYDLRPTDTQRCDNTMDRGWYRFIDSDGKAVQLATSCPGTGRNRCGTVMPLWMDGHHPSLNDGIVQINLCGKLVDDPSASCCSSRNVVFVKHCPGGFFVYGLFQSPGQCSGFCAGNAQRCSKDQWSETDFAPCRDFYPVLKTPPTLKGPIVNNDQSFEFKCQIDYDGTVKDQRFEVVWTFNGRPDPNIKPQTIGATEREATLRTEQLQNHFDQEVGCQVTTFYTGRENNKSKPYQSNVFYFGIKDTPVLSGPTVRGRTSFDFQCTIAFSTTDADQQIEVVWTFDGRQDPAIRPEILTGQSRRSTLGGNVLQAHMNKNIGCQARLVYARDLKTEFRKSSLYFFGIKVSTTRLDINESEREKELTVTSTIPVTCDQDQDCCITFKLMVIKAGVVTIKDSCEHKICSKDWNSETKQASFKIKLVPIRNDIKAGKREASLTFEGILVTGIIPYIAVFKGHKPNPVQVVVKLEAGFRCCITGDPHITGFDLKHQYHMYLLGDYTAYQVKDRDFEVQIRTYKCWQASCVCGVVVKERGNVIRLFACGKPHSLIGAKVSIPSKLGEGTMVMRSPNGRHVGITLPSGSEVKIDIHQFHMDVYIKTPAFDRFKAQGLCGTNDGNPRNDFTHRNGQVTLPCAKSLNCFPNAFSRSWSVTGVNSLFQHIPPYTKVEPVTEHCTCRGEKSATCSPGEHNKNTGIVCNGCQQVTDRLKPTTWEPTRIPLVVVSSDKQWSNDVDASEEDPNKQMLNDQEILDEEGIQNDDNMTDVDLNKKWPSDAGITEAQAIEMCNKNMQTSQLYSMCREMTNITDSALNDCLNDILYGNTTTTMDSIISSFTTNCQADLAADENNYIQDAQGDLIMKAEMMANVCPVECRNHGTCGTDGKCVCNNGWEGETCHIEKGKGAIISWDTNGPLCVAEEKACDIVTLVMTNVNIMDKFQCKVHTLDVLNKKDNNPIISDSLEEASAITVCRLPQKGLSTQNFTVSVTSDGKLFSNELRVHTYDSTCLNCNNSGCVEKSTACHIGGVCYKDQQLNKNDAKLICDVKKQTNAWSPASSNSAITATSLHPWVKAVTCLTTALVLVISA